MITLQQIVYTLFFLGGITLLGLLIGFIFIEIEKDLNHKISGSEDERQ